MRSVIRPWSRLVTREGEERAVPGLDEDEATLAVDAARPLLAASQVDLGQVRSLHVASRTGSGWASTAMVALGLRHVRLEEFPADEFSQRLKGAAETAGPLALWIQSDAPRAHAAMAATQLHEAQAVAHLTGPLERNPMELLPAQARATRRLDAMFIDRLATWETQALAAVPMGAYVPAATWDATLEARYRLLVSTCGKCHASAQPPQDPCPRCGGETATEPRLGPATVTTYTTIARGGGPSEFDPIQDVDGEYGVVVVEAAPGIQVPGMTTETPLSALRIGARMEPVLRRLYAQEGTWRYGTKFRAAP